MKWDFAIGNPAYQDQTLGDNKGFAPPIYGKFIDAACEIADRVEMIHPARFLFNAGSTPKAWNEKMLNDTHFKILYFEQDSSKVFANTDIKGGVAVSYRDAKKDYGAIKHFIVFDELRQIAKKVDTKPENALSNIIFAAESYRFSEKMHQDFPQAVKLLSVGHKYDLKSNVLESLGEIVFFEEAPSDRNEYVRIFGIGKSGRIYRWIKRKYIVPPENFDKYKVFVPKANGSGALGEVLSTPVIGQPVIGHTQSFISIGSFDTESEANALMKYIKSKFCRVLLGILKITQDNPKSKWTYVPLQDFTDNSDINWNTSIANIDKQLYKKYGLSQEEIDFIETHVKEMA